jgi:flagellar basal-body rod protein FlgB
VDKSFRILSEIVQAANARQKVIASNIANADTPGYKAKDVKFGNFLNKELKLLRTDSKHSSNENNGGISGKLTVENNPSWGDGNNVELNVEVAKMTENALIHEAAIKILNAKMKMFKSAIRVQGR